MDILDELLDTNPREKFLQVLQNGAVGAVESALEKLLREHIALRELMLLKSVLGQEYLSEYGDLDEQISLFCVENEDLIQERLNDYFIGLTAEILGAEGWILIFLK